MDAHMEGRTDLMLKIMIHIWNISKQFGKRSKNLEISISEYNINLSLKKLSGKDVQ